MSWVEAIKAYAAANGGKFVIPKRDSEEYKKVKALQEKMSKGDKVEATAPVKAKKEKIAKKANVVEEVPVEVVKTPVKQVVAEKPKKRANVAPVKEEAPAAEPVVKAPRKSAKVVREEKAVAKSIATEESAKVKAKRVLDEARMLRIVQQPVVMEFN